MTKKDFELIARVFREHGWYDGFTDKRFVVSAIYLADALIATNPRFDREKFLQACQPEIDKMLE